MKLDITLTKKNFFYLQIAFVLLAIIIPLSYALITSHIWEDFFITFKHSKNLAEGNGLLYHPGERVHGFTSVFNTLLPALFYWVTGKSSYIPALWLYRGVSIFFYAAAGLFILKFLYKDKDTTKISLVIFGLYYLFLTKTIVFTSNGQEAGFFVFFVLTSILLCYDSCINNWKLIGVLWAGIMFTRPDGFIYISAMSLAVLFLSSDDKKQIFLSLLKAGLVCAAIYLPWFIFVWSYDGTPVPHTVIAKSVYGIHLPKDPVFLLSGIISKTPIDLLKIFLPIYYEFGGWPYWMYVVSLFVGLFCLIYWLLPHSDRLGKYLSLIFFFIMIYFNLVTTIGVVFPWYLTAIETLAALILARGVFYFLSIFIKKKGLAVVLSGGVNIGILVFFTTVFFSTMLQMRVQQEVVENGNRMKIGVWLKENAKAGDRVYLEPLGYIGYFSELKMYDFPGLVSPETVRASKKHNTRVWAVLIQELQPDWLVLRENNLRSVFSIKANKDSYELVTTFDVRDRVNAHQGLPGRGYLLIDSYFLIYKKKE